MKKQRNIGQEILTGLNEIILAKRGQMKLKTTRIKLHLVNFDTTIINRADNDTHFRKKLLFQALRQLDVNEFEIGKKMLQIIIKVAKNKILNDEKWDNRELGATEEYVKRANPKHEKALDKRTGLELISIRMKESFIKMSTAIKN